MWEVSADSACSSGDFSCCAGRIPLKVGDELLLVLAILVVFPASSCTLSGNLRVLFKSLWEGLGLPGWRLWTGMEEPGPVFGQQGCVSAWMHAFHLYPCSHLCRRCVWCVYTGEHPTDFSPVYTPVQASLHMRLPAHCHHTAFTWGSLWNQNPPGRRLLVLRDAQLSGALVPVHSVFREQTAVACGAL